MQHNSTVRIFAVVLVLAVSGTMASHSTFVAGSSDFPRWEDRFFVPGVNAPVHALASTGTRLYVGGEFTTVDAQLAPYLAAWDGSQFAPVDGLNDVVRGLSTDGTGNLYVVGDFTDAGANPDADYVALVTTSGWSALGSGINGTVNTVLAVDDQLFIGGNFTSIGENPDAAYVARWDGREWQALAAGLNGPVHALAADRSGALYVGGEFSDAGGHQDADFLALWNEGSWHPVAAGLNQQVRAVAVHNSTLYVGGDFTDVAGMAEADYIVSWDGDRWSALGTEALSGAVHALAPSADGRLNVGGRFRDAADLDDGDYIAQWDGTEWHAVDGGVVGVVNAVAFFQEELYIGGGFRDIDAIPYGHYLAHRHGESWTMPGDGTGQGLNGTVFSIVEREEGAVVVGGEFTDAGGLEDADHIALWNGESWSALDRGLNDAVYSLAHDGAGRLYVGGDFTDAGGFVDADRIAIWNGTSWEALGPGITNGVYAIGFDAKDTPYIGGRFSNAGGDPDVDYLAYWNGTTWSTLGSGVNHFVEAIQFDAKGNLYIGGRFTEAGGVEGADNVALWDGANWQAFGNGLNNIVLDLHLDSNETLYVAGYFTDAGENVGASGVARWNGTEWEGISTRVGGQIFAIEIDENDNLYAGGFFSNYGNNRHADKIALWDGNQWRGLDTGLNQAVYTLLIVPDEGRLYAGGLFSAAGDTVSSHLGQWQFAAATPAETPTATPTATPLPIGGCASPTVSSVASGYWQDPAVWSTGEIPGPADSVRIESSHALTIISSDSVQLDWLCNEGTIAGGEFAELEIEAAGGIRNEGMLAGFDLPETLTEATVPLIGGNLTLRSPRITNWGTIRSGNGAYGEGAGGNGGNLLLEATASDTDASILNVRGARITSGDGGRGQTRGGASGNVVLRAEKLVRNEGTIASGRGGHCTAGMGGDSGKISLSTLERIEIFDGKVVSGQPGSCGTPNSTGTRGSVKIDPTTLAFRGSATQISGGEVAIYGGQGAELIFDGLDKGAVDAEQTLQIAVGPGGSIDLTGDAEGILVGDKGVAVAADPGYVLLDDGVEMQEVIKTDGNLLLLDATILHAVDLTGPTIHQYDDVHETQIVSFSVQNNSPVSITYDLDVSLSADVEMQPVPSHLEIGPQENLDVAIQIALSPLVASGSITVGVNSTADAGVEAIMVTQLVSSLPQIDPDRDGLPSSTEDTNHDGNFENDDNDKDGKPNYRDADDDGDGIPSSFEKQRDSDGDGIRDPFDSDDDNDGIPTREEDANQDGDPTDDDLDGDGIPDYLEPNNRDNDKDGMPDQSDSDDDGDGIDPLSEDLNGDGDLNDDDTDGDGLPNFLDHDDDGDALTSYQEGNADADNDSIPDYLESNIADVDGDGLFNQLDEDDDGDRIRSSDEDVNGDGSPLNDDSDRDGIPNYLDADDDGDGVPTAQEDPNADGDPTNDDADRDGVPDYLQAQYRGPQANDDWVTALAGEMVKVRVLLNDLDERNSYVYLQNLTQPRGGVALDNKDGTVSYQSAPNYSGRDEFTYTIKSNLGQSSSAKVTVVVNSALDSRTSDSATLFMPLISR